MDKPERTCQRWRLRVNTGYDHLKKRYIQKSKVFHGTKTEAQKALRDFTVEVESGLTFDLRKSTFVEYSEQWLEERRLSGNIAKGTLRKNRNDINRILPFAANIAMTDFNEANITNLLITIKRTGGKRCEEYSGTTMNGVYRVLYQIFEHARKRGIIPSNPCEDVESPKRDTQEKEALPTSEARRLANELTTGELRATRIGFLLALTCGLRRVRLRKDAGHGWFLVLFYMGTVVVGVLEYTPVSSTIRA